MKYPIRHIREAGELRNNHFIGVKIEPGQTRTDLFTDSAEELNETEMF